MSDLATLGFEIDSSSVKQATLDLRAMPEAASASERAAQKLGVTMTTAGATSEEFSRRVLRNIDTLKFQADQLGRTSAEQERYTTLRRAGVSAESAAGQAISASVSALQAQRQVAQAAADATREQAAAARASEENNRRAASAVMAVTTALDFEMAQLGRTATQRAQYEAVRRAGISADSAEGRSIMTKVAALEAERLALANLQVAQLASSRPGAGATGITSYQRLQVGYQLNDVFTQLASGTNPALIAAQQGPQITQVFGGIKNTLAAIPKPLLIGGAAALGVGAIALVANALKDLNDALETQKRRIGDITGDQRLANQFYGDIRKEALAAGEAIDKTAAKFEKFARAGVSVGATEGQTAGLVSVFNQIGRLGGATDSEKNAAADALSKSLSDSVLSASNLDVILENMPGLGRRIADGLGLSVVQLRLMAQQGDVTNKQVFDALLSQQSKVAADFKETGITVGGFFAGVWQLVQDIGVGIYKIVTGIELVHTKAEAARRAQAANANRPTRATPRVIGADGSASTRSLDEMVTLGEAGQTSAAVLNDPSRLMTQFLDLQRAATQAAGEAVLAADKIADSLLQDNRVIQQQIETTTKGIAALQGGLSGLDATKAASETKRLSDALQFLRDRAMDAKTAYGQALEALSTRLQQDELGMTPGQRAAAARTKQLTDSQPGVSTEAAQGVVSGEQLQALDDLIYKNQRELDVQTAITQAMRGGKAAADDAAVAMQVLGVSLDQLGTITPEVQVKLDVLAETLGRIREQARAQATIDASKPLIADLNGIADAMKVVEQGAFAMKRAQESAKAAANENGTGGLQMKVFDAQQALTDATALDGLKKQVDLTNQLAAAAGDVARQKQIQLDYDIRIAQLAAGPGAQAETAERMRAQFAATANLETRNGLADMQKQVDLSQQQLDIIRSGSPDQAAQLAMLAKKNELVAKGADLTQQGNQDQIALAGKKAKIDEQLQWEKDASDATKRSWMNAFDNIQSTGADAFYAIFTNAGITAQSVAQTLKSIFLRTFADIAAAAIIRPLITPIFQGAAGLGLIPGGVVPAATGSTSGISAGGGGSTGVGGFSMPGGGMFGGSSPFGNAFSGISNWMQTPFTGPMAGIGPADMAGVMPGMSGAEASSYFSGLSGGGSSGLGGLGFTPGGVIGGGLSIGMGALSLANSKDTAHTIGGVGQMVGGALMMIPTPWTMAAGAIISLASSILPGILGGGNQEPPLKPLNYSTGFFRFNNTTGQPFFGDMGNQNGGSTLPGGSEAAQSVLSLISMAGGTPVAGKLYGGGLGMGIRDPRQGDKPYFNVDLINPDGSGTRIADDLASPMQNVVEFLVSKIFKADVLGGGVKGASPSLATALTNKDPNTLADTQALVQFVTVFDKLGKAANPVKDAITSLNVKFEEMTQSAQDYGLSLEPINAELAKETKRTAQDFIDGMLDPLAVQMRALQDEQDAAMASAQYIKDNITDVYVDTDKIATYYLNKRAALEDQYYQGAVENLQTLINRLTYGDLANASPDTSFIGTQATYTAALAQAQGGDQSAIANLSGYGEAYANSTRGFLGSSPEAATILNQIRDGLSGVLGNITGGAMTAPGTAANSNGVVSSAQWNQMYAMFQASQADSAALRQTVADLTAQLKRQA